MDCATTAPQLTEFVVCILTLMTPGVYGLASERGGGRGVKEAIEIKKKGL